MHSKYLYENMTVYLKYKFIKNKKFYRSSYVRDVNKNIYVYIMTIYKYCSKLFVYLKIEKKYYDIANNFSSKDKKCI